jgi:hypothetical protein
MTVTQREDAARQLADLEKTLAICPPELRDRVLGFRDFLRVQVRQEPALAVAMAFVLAEIGAGKHDLP